jgi:hypothetical protein
MTFAPGCVYLGKIEDFMGNGLYESGLRDT